jgi:hypothetical protein
MNMDEAVDPIAVRLRRMIDSLGTLQQIVAVG